MVRLTSAGPEIQWPSTPHCPTAIRLWKWSASHLLGPRYSGRLPPTALLPLGYGSSPPHICWARGTVAVYPHCPTAIRLWKWSASHLLGLRYSGHLPPSALLPLGYGSGPPHICWARDTVAVYPPLPYCHLAMEVVRFTSAGPEIQWPSTPHCPTAIRLWKWSASHLLGLRYSGRLPPTALLPLGYGKPLLLFDTKKCLKMEV